MNISKLFCVLISGLAIIGFTSLGYASQEEASHTDNVVTSEAASEHENANEEAGSVQSTDDIQSEGIQYGANPNLESDEQEVKAEEKE